MTPRETRDIVTPAGNKLTVYTYLTGRETRELQTPYLKTAEEYPKATIDDKGLRAAIYEAVQNLTLKMLIVSFNDKTDGQDGFVLNDAILDLPSQEFNFIVRKLNEITAPPDAEEKKTN